MNRNRKKGAGTEKVEIFCMDILNLLQTAVLIELKLFVKHCKVEFTYHRSTSSLKYHLNTLHAIDAQITHPPKQTVAGGFGRLVGEG